MDVFVLWSSSMSKLAFAEGRVRTQRDLGLIHYSRVLHLWNNGS